MFAIPLLLSLVLASDGPTIGQAQDWGNDEEWRTILAQADENLAAKEYPSAEIHLRQAIEQSKSFGDEDPRYSYSLMRMADFLLLTGQWARARPVYLQTLDTINSNTDAGVEQKAHCLRKLADCAFSANEPRKAEALYLKAKSLHEEIDGESSLNVLACHYGLARTYRIAGRPKLAKEEIENALRIAETLPQKPENYPAVVTELAIQNVNRGNLPHAERLFQIAWREREKSGDTTNEDSAYFFEQYARLLRMLQRPVEADQAINRSRDIRRKLYGTSVTNPERLAPSTVSAKTR